jgi:two-component system CitB family sensor kinase
VAAVTAVALAQLIGILLIPSILRILLTHERRTMPRPWRTPPIRFSTQTLFLQLGVVLLVVLLSTAVHAWLTYDRVGREAENQALTLARAVAADPSVQANVLAISEREGTPPPADLRAGPLMAAAEATRIRTGALFVVITDETGLRLAHPDPARLGEKVSTDPTEALGGQEITTRNTGTLGPSAGAKVPVYAPGTGTVVGEVSVGYSMETVGQSLERDIGPVALTAAGALLAGVLASFLLRHRLRRLTMGLEPEEISTLVHDQVAVLQGVDDGVIGVAADGRISVFNAAAQRLLDLPDLAGTPWADAPVPAQLKALTRADAGEAEAIELVAGGRVLVASARKALHRKEDLGWVVMLRDRTELQQLTRQLDAVGTMSTALRAQRHEFANQLHTIAGLMSIGQHQQAREYLAGLAATGPLKFPVDQAELLQDPYLQAFVGAKGVEADERGVTLRIGPETLVRGQVTEPQDVTTVLGNLIDNAVEAAVAGSATDRWVEVEVLDEPHDDGGTLLIVVADSGDGLASGTDAEIVFAEGYTTAMRAIRPGGGGLDKVGLDKVGLDGGGRRGGGQGLGLALARKLARRRGGDIRILETGMPGGPGAVFMASLPGTTAGAKPDIADRPTNGANDGTLSGTAGSGTAGSGTADHIYASEKDDHA